ncbi:type VII secretion protein EccE [Rhodococcus olei]|uniref:type VII secretion protein EccE n=1 Tax=Rhodococcus olei TaxID=2161675 RepID=UPI0031EA3B37
MVTAQVVAVVAGALGSGVGLIWWQAAILAALAAAVTLLPVRGRILLDWASAAVRVRHSDPEAFAATKFRTDDGLDVGLCWTAGTVCTVIEMLAAPGSLTRLGRDEATDCPEVPLRVLAESLFQQGISLAGIDVIGHGRRVAPDSPVAGVYDDLIGPLAATADRTVWLVVRFEATAQPGAVRRRGGGRSGAARAVSVASQRIVRALAERGTESLILTAPAIAAVAETISGGAAFDEAGRSRAHVPVRDGCNTGYAIDPRVLGDRLADVWATRSRTTTVTVRLRPGSSSNEVRVAASCRFTTESVPRRSTLPGLVPTTREPAALRSHLPGAHPDLDSLTTFTTVTPRHLDTLTVPVAGCGQLIGSDATGRAVTVRVAGPEVRRVDVVGEPYLAQQVVLRAVAIGERIAVHSTDPESWRSLVGSVADPDRLTLVDRPAARGTAVTAVVFDGTEPVPLPDTVTAIVVREAPPVDAAPVSIVQPGLRGGRIILWSNGSRTELRLVTIAAETAYLGRPLGASVPLAVG